MRSKVRALISRRGKLHRAFRNTSGKWTYGCSSIYNFSADKTFIIEIENDMPTPETLVTHKPPTICGICFNA